MPNLASQENIEYKWWDPSGSEAVAGQAWAGETAAPFDRLPERAMSLVRKPVWNLSHNSAGIIIRFRSNAKELKVEYGVSGDFAMEHMPATGVSGVDLYARTDDGRWLWCAGKRSFGDTIRFVFKGINPGDNYIEDGLEYRLYLPLYNTVKWLKIGVPVDDSINAMPEENKKPVVVYGTSITQGACASRPGMTWTSILGRDLDMPVINLGFSGEGKLDESMINLMSEIDAAIYVLDCMPNMTAPRFTGEEVKKRVINAVNILLEKHPGTPVLLTEHDGYTDGFLRPERFKNFTDINVALYDAYKTIKRAGIKNVYLLPASEIGIDINCQVDGIHPNDLGMYRYARAYNRYIRVILGMH
ncbi:MAG: hypothetical protein GXO47_01095 [Chlorobi bacterium]|nr:hypothetical protein [Chlorobiota bacterium]